MLRSVSIGKRMFLLLGITLTFALLVGVIFFQNTMKAGMTGVDETQRVMFDAQKEKLQVAVHSMALSIGQTVRDAPSQEAALRIIREAVDPVRFEKDKSGYFFVYQGTVVAALPPKKELVGRDLSGSKDKNGVYYVRELAKAASRGGAFVEYIFPKPGQGDQPKLAYAENIPGTDYWIGTGIYIDNIETERTRIRTAIMDMVQSATTTNSLILLAVFLFLIIPVCIAMIRSIVLPLRATTDAAAEVAGGNLDVRLAAEGKDEVSALQNALTTMVDTLREHIEEARNRSEEAQRLAETARQAAAEAEAAKEEALHATERGRMHAAETLEGIVGRVGSAIEEMSQQADTISEGTDNQRSRINETATAMEEMNATVIEVARNASTAAEGADQTMHQARDGHDVLQQTVSAMASITELAESLKANMHQLGEQSQSIGAVMNVINDIADQTNLLALNAAIEAARAGDAGRGFAVVADEVRKLAEKTMNATKEVGASISAIQGVAQENIQGVDRAVVAIGEASQLASRSGESLEEILGLSEQSASEVQSIATAAEQQSAASEEIAKSVEEINTIAGETAEHMLQTVEALRDLSEQASELQSLIADLKGSGQ